MKKLFAIAFTCVYLTLTVGVVQTTHYCMGRAKSSTLFSFESVKCPCSVLAKYSKQDCCDDEHELLKIDNDQTASVVVSLVPAFFEIGNIINDIPVVGERQVSLTIIHELPRPPDPVPLFTKHCSLVFYDGHMIG